MNTNDLSVAATGTRGWGKIALVTRLEKMVESRFVEVWSLLITQGLRMEDGDAWTIVKERTAHMAANDLARRFLQSDCDSILYLDSDADVGPGFVEELRELAEGHEYDALQAFYTRRGWPPEAIWFKESALGDMMQCLVWKDDHTEETALVGLHATLIRREVLQAMLDARPSDVSEEDFNWFHYPKHGWMSEDAAWSVEARAHGFRLGSTTSVKTGHISRVTTGWETYQSYIQTNGLDQKWGDYLRLVELAADFTGMEFEDAQALALRGSANVREGLDKGLRADGTKHGDSYASANADPEKLRAYYGHPDNGYIWDLIAWNCSPFYERIVAPLREIEGSRVLVVGAGIGGEVEAMRAKEKANYVDIFELPGVLREFLISRYDGFSNVGIYENADSLTDYDHHQNGDTRWNIIVAVDVLEHIHPDEFTDTLDQMLSMLAPDGRFYFHNNFAEFEKYPNHFDNSQLFAEWMADNSIVVDQEIPEAQSAFYRRE